jgi:ribosomal-protein-alanine N-acetyltransferase
MIADVAIRLARSADAREIAAMSRDDIEHGLPWRWRRERVAQAIADRDTNVVVVGEPGSLLAFGIMSYLEEDAHLLLFAVRRTSRRQGIGSAVLLWLEEVARAAGTRRIRLEARRENGAARQFYNEHGYHERMIRKGMYALAVDGIRLEKWLRPAGAAADGIGSTN